MAVVKVLELFAESEESWEDAARQAVAEASKTVRGISSIYMSEFQATVENDTTGNDPSGAFQQTVPQPSTSATALTR